MREASPEQIRHNRSLWKWFPLGQLDAAWTIIELINSATNLKYKTEIEAVLTSLQKLDDKIRADCYPMKSVKSKAKRK